MHELAAETFILYPRSMRPGLANAIVAACEAAGFTPRVGQYAPQLSSTINLVAASLGVSIVPERGPTVAIGLIRKQVSDALAATFDATLDAESRNQSIAKKSPDFDAAIAAFAEKRRPVFQGR